MKALAFLFASLALAQTPPPLGQLIDVGGRRVHLYCTGAGNPAVVIVGAGFSFDWALVQPAVAEFTRVCSYDPSGTAWSDSGPGLECRERVPEIRQLLRSAGIGGPYVLTGFSIGALVARWYAAAFPDEIAGLVLADAPFLDRSSRPPPPTPPGLDSPPVLIEQVPVEVAAETEADFQALPPRDRDLHRWAVSLHPPRPAIDTAERCLAGLEAAPSLGLKPLAVVSTGNPNPAYTAFQAKLLALSQISTQVVADRSGHAIEWDQPEALVRAIRWVVEAARPATSGTPGNRRNK